jgi:hypothetical protein
VHLPCVTAQDVHVPVHALSQQYPSTQLPVAHSDLSAQVSPWLFKERTSSPCSTCPHRRTPQCKFRSSHCCRPSTGWCRRWSASGSGSCPGHHTMTCSCAGRQRSSAPHRPSCCRDRCRPWCSICRKCQRKGPSRCRPCGGRREAAGSGYAGLAVPIALAVAAMTVDAQVIGALVVGRADRTIGRVAGASGASLRTGASGAEVAPPVPLASSEWCRASVAARTVRGHAAPGSARA